MESGRGGEGGGRGEGWEGRGERGEEEGWTRERIVCSIKRMK